MDLNYNNVNFVSNECVERGQFIVSENNKNVIIHPYSLCSLVLTFNNENYLSAFNQFGVDNNSIDACIDFAKKKVSKKIANKHYS